MPSAMMKMTFFFLGWACMDWGARPSNTPIRTKNKRFFNILAGIKPKCKSSPINRLLILPLRLEVIMYEKEINRRKTFAIISHPDAGKTTLTEKLLLFGGAIQVAGAVKSNKIRKHATSDFMEIERQRGISVATSVMTFEYRNTLINLLDTPGHKDFAEDTYRTLTAVDSVILVIDSVNGVEAQTRRLMEVCRMRSTPVIVFINKMDRDGKNRFDLLEEIENELKIHLHPMTVPINSGKEFKGVYDLHKKSLVLFTAGTKANDEDVIEIKDLHSEILVNKIGKRDADTLRED